MSQNNKIFDSDSVAKNPSAKLAKPKVFLIGIDNSVLTTLDESGINATQGSLGTPYKVKISSNAESMRDSSQLKGYAEQEIIFVDLSLKLAPSAVGEIISPEDMEGLWVSHENGLVDPRGLAAAKVQADFDQIISTGGVFVVFASPKTNTPIFRSSYRGGKFWHPESVSLDEWHFLSDLQQIQVVDSSGTEINVCDKRSPMGKALFSAIDGMRFDCKFRQIYDPEKSWIPLAVNKFGETIALEKNYPSGGALFILPQIADKTNFIKHLLTETFPERFPHLFPEIDKGRWTHLPEYELIDVMNLQAKRAEAVRQYESEMERIETEIDAVRKADGWLHELVTQTGDALVEAIVAALSELGFRSIVDMDKIRDRKNEDRREDLQIQDISPTLIIDIKGISNFPNDEDTMQAFKHATLVMREQNRCDVFGLSIINHQRHLPPLQRDNAMPFRKELIEVALQNSQGLMTTWDIYRLVVNKRKNSWNPTDLMPIFYLYGRIEAVPAHYVLIGHVTHVWEHAFGVDLMNSSVCIGDTIAIEFPIYFEESTVESLKVDGKDKFEVSSGDKTGIPWPTSSSRPKKGMRVYVAKAKPQETAV